MYPARYVVALFAAIAPSRYDASGWVWAMSLVASLVFVYAGGAAWLARGAGLLKPARSSLRLVVEAAVRSVDSSVSAAKVYEMQFAGSNAMALPLLRWVVFTSAAVERLERRALGAILAHELAHLDEPLTIKLLRVGMGAAMALPIAFVPAFSENPVVGFLYGLALFTIIGGAMRSLWRYLERRADKRAREHEHHEGAYAAALERIYQLNWADAGVASATHPSLYDRLVQAGAPPNYPRPPAAARGPRLLALAYGLVLSLALGIFVYRGLVGAVE
jgi:Zn-dependent protease with chaperone function